MSKPVVSKPVLSKSAPAIFTLMTLIFGFFASAEVVPEQFGEVMPEGKAISLVAAIASLAQQSPPPLSKIQGQITEVCQKKGCFMVLAEGQLHARVKFKDYGFFVPKNSAGKSAVIYGQLNAVTLTPSERNHFEADAGREGAFTSPLTEYSILASSVLIE